MDEVKEEFNIFMKRINDIKVNSFVKIIFDLDIWLSVVMLY